MFARKVSVCLKPNALRPFVHLMEEELLPWLRTQNGFLDLITLACPDAIEVQVISFWECERSAEACNEGYPENVLKILQVLLDGISNGKTFEVVSSTLERLVPTRPREAETGVEADRSDPDRLGTDRTDSDFRSYETSA
jgi:hypothetical protein